MSLTEGGKLIFVEPFVRSFYNMDFCSCYSPIKFSEMVELVCVLFTPVYFPSSRTQYGRGEKGRRIRGEAARGGDPKRRRSLSLLELL